MFICGRKFNISGNRTLFAPLNSAFKSVPDSVQQRWSNDRTFLKDTILYHLIMNSYGSNDLTNNLILNTNNPGYTLRVNRYNVENKTITTVNGAKLVDIPESVTNTGILFLVPAVFYTFPVASAVDLVVGSNDFTTLLLVIAKAGLTNTFEGKLQETIVIDGGII